MINLLAERNCVRILSVIFHCFTEREYMTTKLYDLNSHLKSFKGQVVSCCFTNGMFHVVLDQTAFFPMGGGQPADTGTLNDIPIIDVSEVSQTIIHYTKTPISVGTEVQGVIDWDKRFRRMQNHSGEHIVSGLINQLYGYHNIGFHMGSNTMTIDYSGVLTHDDIKRIEYLANEAVIKNIPVLARYPNHEELATMHYRSKLELTQNVRIVTIEGYDNCACCAPHVSNTGEIGIIKLLDSMHHKGGIRINALCGFNALDDYNERLKHVTAISRILSSKQDEVSVAVERLQNNLEAAKQQLALANQKLAQAKVQNLNPTAGNLLIFEPQFDSASLREMVNTGMQLCGGVCAAFSGEDGCYRYIIGSKTVDLLSNAKQINQALNGKGGGVRSMIQGSVHCTRSDIEIYFQSFP